jgi:2-dehydro-3-deoxygluconokinase
VAASKLAVAEAQEAAFDVICAGEATLSMSATGGALASSLRLRPGGGAVNVAMALAKRGLRVGLATSLGDDMFGRALRDRIVAAGVDAGGVSLAPPRTGLVLLHGAGGSRHVLSYRGEDEPATVPAGWAAKVLLLSGLSPVVSHGAALCKSARAARRKGSTVVLDANARLEAWAGQDSRAVRSVLREADVVRCSSADLAVLGLDVEQVRAAMRKAAIFVGGNALGDAWATGPFGEVVEKRGGAASGLLGGGDALTASICAELARAGEAREDLWARALRGGRRRS